MKDVIESLEDDIQEVFETHGGYSTKCIYTCSPNKFKAIMGELLKKPADSFSFNGRARLMYMGEVGMQAEIEVDNSLPDYVVCTEALGATDEIKESRSKD